MYPLSARQSQREVAVRHSLPSRKERWRFLRLLDVSDLVTGHVVQTVRLKGLVTDLYGVVDLPRIVRPMAIGFKTKEIEQTVQVDTESK